MSTDILKPLTILQLQQCLQECDKNIKSDWAKAEMYGMLKDLDQLYNIVIDLMARKELRAPIIEVLTEKVSELD